jgi:sugar fermentation stimulation protein A
MARVEGAVQRVHVPDPGRLSELLFPGARVLLRRAPRSARRKTAWTLMAAGDPNGDGWVLTNTFLHRPLAEELLRLPDGPFGSRKRVRAEVNVGGSRLDFLLTGPAGLRRFVEVKGCTLVRGGVGLFPDSPTVRGRRHMDELRRLAGTGAEASVLFLLFGSAALVGPNRAADPGFSASYWRAVDAGVTVHVRRIGYDGTGVVDLGPGGCLLRG